jgi:thiol-disulfide isomerase/thioredoxin
MSIKYYPLAFVILILNSVPLFLLSQNATLISLDRNSYSQEYVFYFFNPFQEADPPFTLSKKTFERNVFINKPTLFYSADKRHQAFIAVPGDTILISKDFKSTSGSFKANIINNVVRKNENQVISDLIDSLGIFVGTEAVDHILPILNGKLKNKDLIKTNQANKNKYNLKSNLDRDNLLYSFYSRRKDFIVRRLESNKITSGFASYLERYFLYDYLSKSLSGIIFDTLDLKQYPHFFRQINDYNTLEDAGSLNIDTYRNYILQIVNYYSYKQHKSKNSAFNRLLLVDSLIKNRNLKDWALYVITKRTILKQGVDESVLLAFQERCSDTSMVNNIKEMVSLFKSAGGSNTNMLVAQNNLQTDFATLIKSKKDSLIYIDFWATWCKPCIEEMVYYKKIFNDYKSYKVSFLFISLDSDKVKWLDFINKKKIGSGVEENYILPGNFSSELAKKFKITEIPRYILFGKGGEIISSDAPRPSDSNFKSLLDKYLNN